MAYKQKCPECGSKAIAHTKNNITDTVSDLYFYCSNKEDCGHTFVMSMSFVFKHSISPSKRSKVSIISSMIKMLSREEINTLCVENGFKLVSR